MEAVGTFFDGRLSARLAKAEQLSVKIKNCKCKFFSQIGGTELKLGRKSFHCNNFYVPHGVGTVPRRQRDTGGTRRRVIVNFYLTACQITDMTKLILLLCLFTLGSVLAAAQEEMKPTEKDKTEAIPTASYMKRGAPIGTAKKVSLAKVLASPAKYNGKTVRIEGVVVRSCKMEGCWAEIAPDKDAKQSVRVTMKGHSFFIPLQSAGSLARAEGVFTVKTLKKEEVDHLINEDGSKFDNRNPDGSVTEVSFEAIGIELKRTTKS